MTTKLPLCSIDRQQTRVEQAVERKKVNFMFLRTIHLQIQKMAEKIDEFEEEEEVVRVDLDETNKPFKKIKIGKNTH